MCHLSPRIQITMLNPSLHIGVEHRKPAPSAYINDCDAQRFCDTFAYINPTFHAANTQKLHDIVTL